jgi:hypothetical protein
MAMGGHRFNPDAWDGYAANQDRIVAGLAENPHIRYFNNHRA